MGEAIAAPRLGANDQTAGHLRRLIETADYSRDTIGQALGLRGLAGIDGVPFQVLLHRLEGEGTLKSLVRLFLLAGDVDDAVACRDLELDSVDDWVEQGILARVDPAKVRGAFLILPGSELVLAGDWPGLPGQTLHRDHVLGDNATAAILSHVTVPGHVGSVLDLGAGGGVQALAAATRAEEVVATDISARAVAFARFNAVLNDRSIECLQGDLFEPVVGRRFDLIVSNPPFVISPESSFTYRDSELGGEGIAQAIIRGVPDHLNEGGFCQMLCNLARHGDEDDWQGRLEALMTAAGLSAWAIVLDIIDVGDYAAGWLRQAMVRDPQRMSEELERWLDYYSERGITDVIWCALTMRMRSDIPRWFDVTKLEGRLEEPAGAQIRRCFEARELLSGSSDDDLLAMRPRIDPDTRLESEMAPQPDGWEVVSSRLIPAGGLPFGGAVDAEVANMLVRCDGTRTLREVLTESAATAEISPDQMITGGLTLIRRLLTTGSITLG